MDEAAKLVFKGKFIKLAVLLNIVVLFFLLSGLLYFLVPGRMTIALGFLVLGILLGIYTVNRYRQTKAWLEENA